MPVSARCAPVLAMFLLCAACGRTAGSAAEPGGPARPAAARRASREAVTGALRFGAARPVAPGTVLASVSCGSATSCVAIDEAGRSYRFDGSSWSGPVPIGAAEAGPGAVSVSCAGPTDCVADPAGGDQVWSWDGAGWSGPTTLGTTGLEALGCARSGYCAAVDAEGDAFAFKGGAWVGTAGDWGSVAAVSCVSAVFCVSASGGLSQWTGEAWTTPTTLGVDTSFTGVSCATPSFCMAVDAGGQAVQWDGTGWSAPVPVLGGQGGPGAGPELDGVSCPSSSLCVAIDSEGGVATWHGGAWAVQDVDGNRPLTALSCPTVSVCVVVDRAGDAVVGTAPRTGRSRPVGPAKPRAARR